MRPLCILTRTSLTIAPIAHLLRRKGKALRAGQARLFETLLPIICVDLQFGPDGSRRAVPRSRPRGPARDRLCGAEHLIAQASANPDCGFIGTSPSSTGWPRPLPPSMPGASPISGCIYGDAIDLLACWQRRWPRSSCSIPTPGRSAGTGSAACTGPTGWRSSRGC